MMIYFEDEDVISSEMLDMMNKAALACLLQEGIDTDRTELSVTFVSREKIRDLNRSYRGADSVTDVLSFPQYKSVKAFPQAGTIVLGDVVICRERAQEQAEEFGHSYEREIIYLFTHSVFHLLGYDHMEDAGKKNMRAKEEAVMTRIGLPRL